MSAAVLEVRRAGPLVSFQDQGRPGRLRLGVPASGPMDPFAHAAAHAALGRPGSGTAVEVSVGGLTVACAGAAVTVAVCGGQFDLSHNGALVSGWAVVTLRPGDVLAISSGPWGSWCYLAVAGELRATHWLGSTSTHVRAGLGGGLLRPGDRIVVHDPVEDDERDGPIEVPASAMRPSRLRVVLGPQTECFVPGAVETLLGTPYVLTSAYDRMGVRLDGAPLPLLDALAIPSTPTLRGSVQVAGDGLPTLLLADHQTTGGYPKIATVVADDVTRAVQLRPGDGVRFVAIDPAAAIRSARVAASVRAAALTALRARPGTRTRRLLGTNLIGGVHHALAVDPDEHRCPTEDGG